MYKVSEVAKFGLDKVFLNEYPVREILTYHKDCILPLEYIDEAEVITLATSIEIRCGFGTADKRNFSSSTIDKLRLIAQGVNFNIFDQLSTFGFLNTAEVILSGYPKLNWTDFMRIVNVGSTAVACMDAELWAMGNKVNSQYHYTDSTSLIDFDGMAVKVLSACKSDDCSVWNKPDKTINNITDLLSKTIKSNNTNSLILHSAVLGCPLLGNYNKTELRNVISAANVDMGYTVDIDREVVNSIYEMLSVRYDDIVLYTKKYYVEHTLPLLDLKFMYRREVQPSTRHIPEGYRVATRVAKWRDDSQDDFKLDIPQIVIPTVLNAALNYVNADDFTGLANLLTLSGIDYLHLRDFHELFVSISACHMKTQTGDSEYISGRAVMKVYKYIIQSMSDEPLSDDINGYAFYLTGLMSVNDFTGIRRQLASFDVDPSTLTSKDNLLSLIDKVNKLWELKNCKPINDGLVNYIIEWFAIRYPTEKNCQVIGKLRPKLLDPNSTKTIIDRSGTKGIMSKVYKPGGDNPTFSKEDIKFIKDYGFRLLVDLYYELHSKTGLFCIIRKAGFNKSDYSTLTKYLDKCNEMNLIHGPVDYSVGEFAPIDRKLICKYIDLLNCYYVNRRLVTTVNPHQSVAVDRVDELDILFQVEDDHRFSDGKTTRDNFGKEVRLCDDDFGNMLKRLNKK